MCCARGFFSTFMWLMNRAGVRPVVSAVTVAGRLITVAGGVGRMLALNMFYCSCMPEKSIIFVIR